MYYISRDGISFLIPKLRGKKPAEWHEKYIAAFNQMAKEIERLQTILLRQSRQQAKLSWQQARLEGKRKRTELVDAIKNLNQSVPYLGNALGCLFCGSYPQKYDTQSVLSIIYDTQK